jgi:hypothetical protein
VRPEVDARERDPDGEEERERTDAERLARERDRDAERRRGVAGREREAIRVRRERLEPGDRHVRAGAREAPLQRLRQRRREQRGCAEAKAEVPAMPGPGGEERGARERPTLRVSHVRERPRDDGPPWRVEAAEREQDRLVEGQDAGQAPGPDDDGGRGRIDGDRGTVARVELEGPAGGESAVPFLGHRAAGCRSPVSAARLACNILVNSPSSNSPKAAKSSPVR